MNQRIRQRPMIAVAIVVIIIAIGAIGGYGLWLAGSVNALPWQEVPTPYAGAPFEGIPGFGGTSATPTP